MKGDGTSGGAVIFHLVARGRVQGVGYRAFVAFVAQERGLAGWVRNRRDGSVEAVLAGAEELVDEAIGACREGAGAAQVSSLEVHQGTPDLLDLRPPGEIFAVILTL